MEQQLTDHLLHCPSCLNHDFITHLELDDYFLSQEHFTITKCTNCGLMITVPQPKPSEIGKYYKSSEYVSHATKKSGIESYVYNFVRKITLSSKTSLIKKYATGNRLLDLGCATGVFLDHCQRKGYSVKGIEPDENAREYACQQFGLSVHDTTHLHELSPRSFDIITMWHVLEHVSDLNERMDHVNNLLTDVGTVFIALPNPSSYDAQFYNKFWAAYDVPRHLYHFTQDSFTSLMHKHSLQIVKVIPMIYDSYYISLQSEKYKNGRKSFSKSFYRGLRSNLYARSNNMNYSSLIYILKKF